MNTAFESLKKACTLVANTWPNPGNLDEYAAIHRLRCAIQEWEASGEDVPTVLFTDETHCSLILSHWGRRDKASKYDGNELYQLESDCCTVTFTGEQMDSICKQWQAFKEKAKK